MNLKGIDWKPGIAACGLCLFLLAVCLPALAQREDTHPSSFKSKQKAMLELVETQLPELEKMQQRGAAFTEQLREIDALLRKPHAIRLYRDSLQVVLVELRKRNDRLKRDLHTLFFQWHAYSQDLMSVYTRYGEMKARNIEDEGLARFLLAYRRMLKRVGIIAQDIKDVYNETDYLLTSKLE